MGLVTATLYRTAAQLTSPGLLESYKDEIVFHTENTQHFKSLYFVQE